VPAVVASAQLFIDGPRRARAALWHAVLARCIDRYIAVSQHVAERLRERLGLPAARIRVIPNAVPVGRPARRDVRLRASVAGDPGRPLVLTVARLHAQKGLPYLLRAASAIPDAVFAIAGEGEEREALESLARSLGIAERVRFLGHRRDVAALLAACDVFVLPSLYEGLPLSVLEAMAAGAPVVATDIGGTNEALTNDDTGVLVPPADAAALARAIQALLADRERARRLAAAARQYVRRHHSAAAMADDVGRVYEELLATGGPT
jgi:glycosyltransferase involved in cell wall biosynthesis